MNIFNEFVLKYIAKSSNYLFLAFSMLLLLSCSTYSTKFTCGEGIGLPCLMMRDVDRMIDSGEINKLYKANCKGKKCQNNEDEFVKSKAEIIKAKLTYPETSDDVVIEDSSRTDNKSSGDMHHDD